MINLECVRFSGASVIFFEKQNQSAAKAAHSRKDATS
jgi:hypothetical protein